MPIFNHWDNINRLKIESNYVFNEKLLQSIQRLKNLINLEWYIVYKTNFPNDPPPKSAITPCDILDNTNLNRLKFSLFVYDNSLPNPQSWMVEQFEKVIFHKHFKRLQALEWHLPSLNNKETTTLFTGYLPRPSHPWDQLTRLSLTRMDSFLMNYIIRYCPNLQRLYFESPLVLPESNHCLKLPPLTHLRFLSCTQISKKANSQPRILHHLFPNVTNIYLFVASNSITGRFKHEPCFIPKAFPNLKFVAFERGYKEITDLANQPNLTMEWETLYLRWNGDRVRLYKKLIEKLPKLKFIYLYDVILHKGKLAPNHVKVFLADELHPLSFQMNLYKQIQ